MTHALPKYRVWDVETTTYELMKRKASPFDPRNWVVTHAWKRYDEASVTEERFGNERPPQGWFVKLLQGITLLVGFNIKFDLLHAIYADKENLEAWMSFVARGGMVWDCQLAEYLLNGMSQRDHMLSLDEVSVRYGGETKVDEVKVLWAAGVQTNDIEPELLTRYLCGGPDENGHFSKGDIENTEVVFLGQLQRAREADQVNSIMLNMGALISTTEKERNGMFVDTAMGHEQAGELREEIEGLTAKLATYLPENLPFDFNWGSRYHKSALIFGGRIKYPKREYLLAVDYGSTAAGEYLFPEDFASNEDFLRFRAYANKTEKHYVLVDGTTTPTPPNGHIEGGDAGYAKFATGKNKGQYKTKNVTVADYDKPKSRMGEDYFTFEGFAPPQKKWATSEPGVFSVTDEVIEELGVLHNVPFLKDLARLTKLSKDLGTYYIATDSQGRQKGMLSLVGPDGIIHHKINQTSTVTGRFSSSDPNLQNVPKGNNSKVKSVFVSRFGPDGKIIQSDFTALEVYIQAILTGCKQLIEDLLAGLDMHVKRLATKEGISYEECFKLCKGYTQEDGTKVPPVKEWDYKRTGAKVFSFQRAYGAGAAKIAASTGMPIEDVIALIEAEDLMYPEIGQFYEKLAATLKATRKPTGRVIPHPEVRGVMCHIGEGVYRTPDNKLYLYTEHPAPEFAVKRGEFQNFSPTEIKNYVVQGEGGEWAKAADYIATREFYRRKNFDHRALLVNQVHDAQYADAAAEVAFEAAALLHASMEAASDYMEWRFDWPIPVPVPSDTTWGRSMMEEEPIPGVRDRAAELRLDIRRLQMGGYTPSFVH